MSARLHYHLELIPDISVPGISYGSIDVDYGDGIYGQRATDPTDLQTYVAVPVASSYNAPYLIEAHVADVFPADPIAFRIMAFGGPFEAASGAILDLVTVNTADLILDRISTGPPVQAVLPMTINLASNTVIRDMEVTDLTDPGIYRLAIVMTFVSGRRLTVPANDYTTMRVSGEPSDGGGGPTVAVFDGIQAGNATVQGTDLIQGGNAAVQGTDIIQGGSA